MYLIQTAEAHCYKAGDVAILSGAQPTSGPLSYANGAFRITRILSSTSFECASTGPNLNLTPMYGTVRVEKPGLQLAGSKAMLLQSRAETGILGPYMFDPKAPYVLSYKTAKLQTPITRGNPARLVTVTKNELPKDGGKIVFDFGTDNEEGPVRYFYKPSENILFIDPSYTFQKDHSVGGAMVLLNRLGGHSVSSTGVDYAGYITDPSVGRAILQDLIESVKSAGVFADFIVRYPEQLYSSMDVYGTGTDPDQKVLDIIRKPTA